MSKETEKPKLGKKTKLGLAVGVFFMITIGVIVITVKNATNRVNESNDAVPGNQTNTKLSIKTNDVKQASMDASIDIPEQSPIAKKARELEEARKSKAIEQGSSYIPRTRIIGAPSESDAGDNDQNKPNPQEVDELGNEKRPVTESQGNADDDDSQESANSGDLPLPNPNDATPSSDNKLVNALNQRTPAERLEEQVKIEKSRAELAKLKEERVKAGASKLYSHIPYVPKAGTRYSVTLPDIGNDRYTSTTSYLFESDEDIMVSALQRTDGGKTLYGKKYNLNEPSGSEKQIPTAKTPTSDNKGLEQSNNTKSSTPETKVKPTPLIKAGAFVYAKTTLPIDSDAPGPVRIELLTGNAKNTIGFGSFKLIESGSGIALTLNNLLYNDTVIPVKAWALSLTDELPVFDDDVDHHYIYRYGGLLGGLFMSGFLSSLSDATTVTSDQTTTTVTSAISSTGDRMIYSLATAADGFLPIFYDMANRPVQVKIPKGQEMYLLFENAVYEQMEEETPKESAAVNRDALGSTSTQFAKSNNVSASEEANSEDGYLRMWQTAKSLDKATE